MNFRFTKIKTIISILVGIIILIIGGVMSSFVIGCFPSPCSIFVHIKNAIIPAIVLITLTYVIWSLIEEKKS